MKSLSSLYPDGERRGSKALQRLQGAYERLFFKGHASAEDRHIVLADIAAWSGYFYNEAPTSNAEEVHQNMGKRAVMARIVRLGFGDETDLSALFLAAGTEAETNNKEKPL